MARKEDIVNNTVPCDDCGKRYELKVNEGISPAICKHCKQQSEQTEKEAYLNYLKTLSIVERLEKLEDIAYEAFGEQY